ncbi:MAG: hypothetical protein GY804_09215 [Alphaproteobacteria bacterium]|nr:hypothetical protein [Alphaproteobacteria bacterium]
MSLKYTHRRTLLGKMAVYLDTTGILDVTDYDGPETFSCAVSTYGNLNNAKVNEKCWAAATMPANKLFEAFTDEESMAFVKFFINTRLDILEYFYDVNNKNKSIRTLPAFTMDLSKQVLEMDGKINFVKKVKDYITENEIESGVKKVITMEPQYSKEKTITYAESMEIVALIIISKTLFPLMGELIDQLKRLPNTINFEYKTQDIHAAAILKDILSKYFKTIYLRLLEVYIHGFASKENRTRIELSYGGMNEQGLKMFVMSGLFVRNFINLDLFADRTTSVASYIHSIITSVIKTRASDCLHNRNRVSERKAMVNDEEPGNAADLDIHSLPSSKNFDLLPIINNSIPDVIERMIGVYDLSIEEFNEFKKWYISHPITPNFITESLLSGYVSNFMSGYNVPYLNSDRFTNLIIIVQLILFKSNMWELGLILSSISSSDTKELSTTEIQKFKLFDQNAANIERFYDDKGGVFLAKMWRDHVGIIIENLTTKEFIINVPPQVLNNIGVSKNGGYVNVTAETLKQFFIAVNNLL